MKGSPIPEHLRENTTAPKVPTHNIMRALHPIACLFHVIFKVVAVFGYPAITRYMFLGLFTKSNVTIFVTVLLSSCLDFWVTKNVTGRYLIGLRWWSASDISSDEDLDDEDNEDKEQADWYFESFPYDVSNSIVDVNIFWFSQCATTGFWSVFLILKTLGLSMFWVFIN